MSRSHTFNGTVTIGRGVITLKAIAEKAKISTVTLTKGRGTVGTPMVRLRFEEANHPQAVFTEMRTRADREVSNARAWRR